MLGSTEIFSQPSSPRLVGAERTTIASISFEEVTNPVSGFSNLHATVNCKSEKSREEIESAVRHFSLNTRADDSELTGIVYGFRIEAVTEATVLHVIAHGKDRALGMLCALSAAFQDSISDTSLASLKTALGLSASQRMDPPPTGESKIAFV